MASAGTTSAMGDNWSVKKWIGGGLMVLLGSIVVALTTLGLYQAVVSSLEEANLELPGAFVRVNNHDLYVNCQGPSSGRVILLENGMGVVSDNWAWVQRDLSETYRVCAYDRAGIGNSEAATGPVDAVVSSDELAGLLDVMEIREPIIIVAHSYGALMSRVFAHKYPSRVAGLVFVDSSHQDMGDRFPPEAQEGFADMLAGFGILESLNRFSAARVMGVADMFATGLQGDAYSRAYHHYATSAHMAGSDKEAEGWARSAAAARNVSTLGNLTMTVMMVDGWDDFMMPSWSAMQRELAMLSSSSRFVTIHGADHFGAINESKYAKQVAKEADRMARIVF